MILRKPRNPVRSKEIALGDRWVDGAYRRPVDARAGVRRIRRIDRLVQAATRRRIRPQPVIAKAAQRRIIGRVAVRVDACRLDPPVPGIAVLVVADLRGPGEAHRRQRNQACQHEGGRNPARRPPQSRCGCEGYRLPAEHQPQQPETAGTGAAEALHAVLHDQDRGQSQAAARMANSARGAGRRTGSMLTRRRPGDGIARESRRIGHPGRGRPPRRRRRPYRRRGGCRAARPEALPASTGSAAGGR